MFPNRPQPSPQSIERELHSQSVTLRTVPDERPSRPIENALAPGLRKVDQFPYRILVVDDEPSILETASSLLKSQGYEVLTASDGLDGLGALTKSLPDVIISDLHMPRMSGFEFLAIVRQRFPHIAVIAMSGAFVPGESLAVISADAFWQKGQPIRKLFQEIARVVEGAPVRPERGTTDTEPPLIEIDNSGHLMIPCPNCMRPGQIEASGLNGGVHETICSSCNTIVKFEINHVPRADGSRAHLQRVARES